MRRWITVAAACAMLGACVGPGEPGEYGISKSTLGTVVGGLGGAAAGGVLFGGRHGAIGRGSSTQLLGALGGGLLGAWAGNSFGRSLDRADHLYAERASRRAAAGPLGEPITWSNPESGAHGTVVATREGYTSAGGYCREFQQTIVIGGRAQQGYGTACLMPDGQWRVVQ